jgi:hypothetical protein
MKWGEQLMKMMRQAYFEDHGGPDVIRIGETAVPEPQPGQVLIEVERDGAKLERTSYTGRYSNEVFRRPSPEVLDSLTGGVLWIIKEFRFYPEPR